MLDSYPQPQLTEHPLRVMKTSLTTVQGLLQIVLLVF